MICAIIENGIVVNTCVGGYGIEIPEGEGVSIGWTYNGTIFSPPVIPVAQQKSIIQNQIDTLETKAKMNRFVREAMIALSVQQATLAGLTEPQLYAANNGYRLIKDHDALITSLRVKMEAIV